MIAIRPCSFGSEVELALSLDISVGVVLSVIPFVSICFNTLPSTRLSLLLNFLLNDLAICTTRTWAFVDDAEIS